MLRENLMEKLVVEELSKLLTEPELWLKLNLLAGNIIVTAALLRNIEVKMNDLIPEEWVYDFEDK